MSKQVGAPKGGRVHWLLYHLPGEFKNAYTLQYNYARHNYLFVRYSGRKVYDVFIVKQTSRHYWRMMYCCSEKDIFECFGYKNTRMVAEIMYELFKYGGENP